MVTTLIQLRYFVAVAEELSFTRAATKLHLSQPSLSAQVRALERSLGQRLFTRTTRKVELTEAGVELYARISRALADIDDALTDARLGGQAPLGIAHTESARRAGLDAVLDELQLRGHDTRLALMSHDRVLAAVAEGRVHAGVVREAPPEGGLHVEILRREPLVAVVGERSPLARRTAVSAADLDGAPVVCEPGDDATAIARALARLCEAHGVAPRGVPAPSPAGVADLLADDAAIVVIASAGAAAGAWPALPAIPVHDASAWLSLDLVTPEPPVGRRALIADAGRQVARREGWLSGPPQGPPAHP